MATDTMLVVRNSVVHPNVNTAIKALEAFGVAPFPSVDSDGCYVSPLSPEELLCIIEAYEALGTILDKALELK